MSLSEFRERAARRQAAAYIDFFSPVTGQFVPALRDRLGPARGFALDLGCGDGLLSTQMRASGWHVTAVDYSREMARIASAAGCPNVVVGDATALPLADGVFGAIGAAFVLPHLPDLRRALAESARVLASGGSLAMTGWAAPHLSPLTGLLTTLLERTDDPELREAQRRRRGEYLVDALHIAGFVDIEVDTIGSSTVLPSATAWWSGLITASFGLGKVVQALSPDAQRTLRADFLAAAEDFSFVDGELYVPVSVMLISARKG